MSIKVSVYVPTLDAAMLPRIVRRFNEVGMQCQFHPKFALDASKDSGVVFMRLRVDSPPVPQYGHTELLSGFELSFKDFRYTAPIAVTPSANEKLKACNRILTIQMPATPTSALRAGLYFAAFLAEVTDGIVYAPRSDKYLEPKQALEQFGQDVAAYENDLPPEYWSVVPFSAWREKAT